MEKLNKFWLELAQIIRLLGRVILEDEACARINGGERRKWWKRWRGNRVWSVSKRENER